MLIRRPVSVVFEAFVDPAIAIGRFRSLMYYSAVHRHIQSGASASRCSTTHNCLSGRIVEDGKVEAREAFGIKYAVDLDGMPSASRNSSNCFAGDSQLNIYAWSARAYRAA